MRINELFEESNTHMAFCFGRMNPPTIGHKQLLDTLASVSNDYQIFLSQSQDKKKNPLDYITKIKFVKALFPQHAAHVVEDTSLNTIMKVASYLYDQGVTHVTVVAGSDRIAELKKLIEVYNGVEGKGHGFYNFKKIDYKSAGERDPDADGVEGVSASLAREKAVQGDVKGFEAATGAGKYTQALYKAVRAGLGINNES